MNNHLYILFLISLAKIIKLKELNEKLLTRDETTCQQPKDKYIMCLLIIVKKKEIWYYLIAICHILYCNIFRCGW